MPFFILWKFVEIINIQNAHTHFFFCEKTHFALIIATCETSKIYKKEFIDPKILNWIIDKKSYRVRDAKEEERMNGKNPFFMPLLTTSLVMLFTLLLLLLFIAFPKLEELTNLLLLLPRICKKKPKFNVFLSYTRAPSNEFYSTSARYDRQI